jgi:hypothetical protein
MKDALACGELARRVPQSRKVYWAKIQSAIGQQREPAGGRHPGTSGGGACGILRKESIMKTSSRIWRAIACGGLSLALLGGVGFPISAGAASSNSPENVNQRTEHRQEFRAMREKMLAQAKAEDAALEKLIGELNKAPEAKKADIEAAILTKLVAQRHQMLKEWESMHGEMAQRWHERTQVSTTGNNGSCMRPGMKGQTAAK